MLSERISSWPICSGYASVPDSYAQRTHQFLTRMLRVHIGSWCLCSAFFEGNALCACINTWRVCSVHAPVPNLYAQHMHKRMLNAHISSWRACSVQASFPYTHAEGIQNKHFKIGKLMRMLRLRLRNWCVCSRCASVPDLYAQRAHKGWSMRVRNSIFSIILKVPKASKVLKNCYWNNKCSQKLHEKNFLPKLKKILLKIILSICVRNFAASNEPLNIKRTNFYFNPKVATP